MLFRTTPSNSSRSGSRCPMQRLRILPALLGAAVAVAATLGITSCNTDGCTENRSALPLMGFYTSPGNKPLTLDSIDLGGVGAPHDSLLVKARTKVQKLYLPFRSTSPSTSFFIHYAYPAQGLDNPLFNDTITFHYSAEPYFASEECGAMYNYRIRRVTFTRHLIDSIGITDSLINNYDSERIRVYIRTAASTKGGGLSL